MRAPAFEVGITSKVWDLLSLLCDDVEPLRVVTAALCHIVQPACIRFYSGAQAIELSHTLLSFPWKDVAALCGLDQLPGASVGAKGDL